MPGTHSKPRRLRNIKLGEVSAVTKPANSSALAEFSKASAEQTNVEKAYLTTAVDGHTHLIQDIDGMGSRTSGHTTPGGGTGEYYEGGHVHPWTMDESRNIVIGEARGHTHAVEVEGVAKSESTQTPLEAPVPEETETQPKEVVYKSLAGVEYYDVEKAGLAKQLDAAQLENDNMKIEKRAREEFPVFVAKSDSNETALVKSVLASGDANAIAGLQALHTSMVEMEKLTRQPSGAAHSIKDEDTTKTGTQTAQGDIVKTAREYAAKNNVSVSVAYNRLLNEQAANSLPPLANPSQVAN